MLDEIYNWIDSRTGVSYDFNQELSELSKGMLITSPNEFRAGYLQIIDELTDCIEAIKKYRAELPEEFPGYKKLQELFAATVLDGITTILESYMDKLNLKHIQIDSVDDLNSVVEAVCALINLFRYNTSDEIIEKNMFEKLDNEYDNVFTDRFEIVASDMLNLGVTIESLHEIYDDTEDD